MRESRTVAIAFVTAATFIDLVAYSIAVPVLPDLSQRLGASPTIIGLLFASFGVTMLGFSVPMGAVSDRIGRKLPLVAGCAALACSSVLFASADRLPWSFASPLFQGAADAVTWVVGFALIADLYGPEERGARHRVRDVRRELRLPVGPTLGGWLKPAASVFRFLRSLPRRARWDRHSLAWLPEARGTGESVSTAALLRVPSVAMCAIAVVVAGATIAMLEPVLPLFLSDSLGLGPARIGLMFGVAAVASTGLHPVFGHFADRWGGWPLMIAGLTAIGLVLPVLSFTDSFVSTTALYVLVAVAVSLVVTPSLAFMAETISAAGVGSFGVAYGVYNFAWAVGLLAGPAYRRDSSTKWVSSAGAAVGPVVLLITFLLVLRTFESVRSLTGGY